MRTIYFNEQVHSYTDELGNKYTSVTTVIDKYKPEFDRPTMARNVYKKYYNRIGHRYYGMTIKEILYNWGDITQKACDKGNKKHNYLEQIIKEANGYKLIEGTQFINDRIYTVDNILENHSYGRVDLQYFINKGLYNKYPTIFETIEYYSKLGYSIYPEICVYSYEYLISGLIDVLLIKGNEFVILDWKTNKDDLYFRAGYFKRDYYGKETIEWVNTDNRLYKPLQNLQDCKGSLYTLQVALYGLLTEMKGLKCKDLHLCHIRDPKDNELEKVEWHNIEYIKSDVQNMIDNHYESKYRTRNTQLVLNIL